MIRMNKVISIIVLACFLLNTAGYDLAFGQALNQSANVDKLAAPSVFSDIVGIQPKDKGRIQLALADMLMKLFGSNQSITMDTLKTIQRKRHFFKERTIFQPADIAIFFQEIKLANAVPYVKVRLKDEDGLRTYYAAFSLQKDKDGGIPINVYTEEEYAGTAGFKNGMPGIKPEDAAAVNRYAANNELIIDKFIRERIKAGDFAEMKRAVAEESDFDHRFQDRKKPTLYFGNFLLPAQVELEKFLDIFDISVFDAFDGKNIVFIKVPRGIDYPAINENSRNIKVKSHTSENAVYFFLGKVGFEQLEKAFGPLYGIESGIYNDQTRAATVVTSISLETIVHEIGVAYGLPYTITPDGKIVNDLDRAYAQDYSELGYKILTQFPRLKNLAKANLDHVKGRDYAGTDKKTSAPTAAKARKNRVYLLGREPSQYGPHPSQENLRPLFEKIAWGRKNAPGDFKIKRIYAFKDQKHGMAPKEAISFGIVLNSHKVIITDAPVMGGISAGGLEPSTHAGIKEAIKFFNDNVAAKFVGLNVARPDEITDRIIKIDEKFRKAADDKTAPRFSYIGAEIAVGISMVSTIALAEALHVPVEVVINYRYNEYALSHGLAEELRPMSIPVNYSVVWEGGKHGVAKYLHELVKEEIINDDRRFPARFKDEGLIKDKDKGILLATVPPQELQIIVFAPNWKEAERIGVKLTKQYQGLLKANGIKTKYGAESGFTTEQVRTADGRLITTELVLDILEQAADSLDSDESKYVRFADDLAASEMYIPEIDMYYVGPAAAATIPGISEQSKNDGLVTNAEFTQYKLARYKNHPRFISCEDWAHEDKIEHWQDAKQIMPSMVQMGDDNNVSRADLIRKFKDVQNAHLHKPNQVSEEQASMESVATSHSLDNVVIWSHRGTRSPQEKYTAWGAIGTGSFGGKWTLLGPGRSALIAAMTQADIMYREAYGVEIPYQGGLVLKPNGPYKNYGFAKRVRGEIAAAEAKALTMASFDKKLLSGDKTVIPEILAYHRTLTNPNDRQILYEWLQHHESALAAEAIAKVGLIWKAVTQKLVGIISGKIDGNRHAAARQLTELADQGTYGGLEASDKAIDDAKIALDKLSRVVYELVQPVAFPEAPKVPEGVKPGVLVITRHGETSWSEALLNKWAGWHDAKITEKGGQEAFNSGEQLRGIDLRFDLGFTSDLSRAQVTMQRFLEGFGQPDLPISSYLELRERNYGDLIGWRRALVEKTFGESQYKKWRRGYEGNYVRPPGGENLRDVMERSIPCFVENMLREIANGKNVIISAHGNSLRSILIYLREHTTGKTLPEEKVMKLEVPLSTPIVIKFDKNLKHEELWVVRDKVGSKEINEFLPSAPLAQAKDIVKAGAAAAASEKSVPLTASSTKIAIFAQGFSLNVGPYTGETNLPHLKEIGIGSSLVGHSETRLREVTVYDKRLGTITGTYIQQGDTDEMINQKLKLMSRESLETILCVGEPREVRDMAGHVDFVLSQIKKDLNDLSEEEILKAVKAIAYEPIWAINTGLTARDEDAQAMCKAIRDYLKEAYSEELAKKMRIMYGGSVKPGSARGLFSQPDIDGFLIGGASLKIEDFGNISKTVNEMGPKEGRAPIVAANWKAEPKEKRDSLKEFNARLTGLNLGQIEVVMALPSVLLTQAKDIVKAGTAAVAPMETAPQIGAEDLLKGIPKAVELLKDRNLKGENVSVRVNLNVKINSDGSVSDITRLELAGEIVSFLLGKEANVILFGHNGRKSKDKDDRKSLEPLAKIFEKLFPGVSVTFHKGSIDEAGLHLARKDIKAGINILENVRFATDFEEGERRGEFAQGLIGLSDGVFIFDAFADVGSKGASIEDVPLYAREAYAGPAMVKEFELLQSVLSGYDALVFGGEKLDKVSLLKRLVAALSANGFAIIGSGPSAVLNGKERALLNDLRTGNNKRVMTAIDYKNADNTFDIGPETIQQFIKKLAQLRAGNTVVINGTMGYMEFEGGKYQEGTAKIFTQLKGLAKRGVRIIVVGGDASSSARKYGLDKCENVVLVSGGGVPLKILAGEQLSGIKAIREALNMQQARAAATSLLKIFAQGFSLNVGPYTGETNLPHLKEIGIGSSLVGHSETRLREVKVYDKQSGAITETYIQQGDTDEMINQKLKLMSQEGLETILCVGEPREVRDVGEHLNFVLRQINKDLKGLSEEEILKTVKAIAYEPIWAINTGLTARDEDAQAMCKAIRDYLKAVYSEELAKKMRIMYGGSVKPKSAKGLFSQPDIDGFLIGGASLKIEDFGSISQTVNELGPKEGRAPIVAANWKAEPKEKRDSLAEFNARLTGLNLRQIEVVMALPSVLLAQAKEIVKGGAVEASPNVPADSRAAVGTAAPAPSAISAAKQQEIALMESLAEIAGIQVVPPNERYNLLVTSEFFANDELGEHQNFYGDRFDIDSVSGNTADQFIENLLKKAGTKKDRTVALLPDETASGKLEERHLQALKDAGIRFIMTNRNELSMARDAKDTYRAKFQRDTYAIMLLVRSMDDTVTTDSSIYRLLSFYLKTHFNFSDKVAIDDYIMAIAKNDIGKLVMGILAYKPAQAYDVPDYNNVAASLISA